MRVVDLLWLLLVLTSMILLHCAPSVSSASTDLSGYQRVRLRAHRRRHRVKHVDHTEVDQLYEMLHEDEQRVNARRSKNVATKRERNEELCASNRVTYELNTHEYEFDPPFMVHIRCRNQADYDNGLSTVLEDQTCVHGMLRCVQQYSERDVSRRPVGSHHWHPHTLRDVPTGCECMWPVDKYGHQEL